jgi:predicted nucleic acid-binding protein
MTEVVVAGVSQIVLDTNIVLDLLVFRDDATLPLRDALQTRQLQWVATVPMRDELERVLAYPQIAKR